jgi:hypothetical protein
LGEFYPARLLSLVQIARLTNSQAFGKNLFLLWFDERYKPGTASCWSTEVWMGPWVILYLLDLARRGEDDKASEVIDDIIGDGSGGNPCPALATNALLNTLTIAKSAPRACLSYIFLRQNLRKPSGAPNTG